MEVVDASARSLDFQLNGVHSASVTVPLTSDAAAFIEPGSTRLEVRMDTGSGANVMVFWGELPASGVKFDSAADTATLTFFDPRWRWSAMYSQELVFNNVDVGTIIWQAISEWNNVFFLGEWPASQGSTTTGVLKTATYHVDDKTISDLVSELTRMVDGPDVDVSFGTGAPKLDVWARMGTDLPAVSLRFGELIDSNVQNVVASYTDTFNAITSKWTDSSSGASSSFFFAPGAEEIHGKYGALQKIIQLPDPVPASYGEFVQTGAYEVLKQPRLVLEVKGLTYEAPQPFVDFYLGDTVYVTAKKGALQVDSQGLRVHGIHIDVDQEGNQQTDITTAEV